MLTDAEARDLLHAAATTIEVEPDQPLPTIDRLRIWPMLAAAAAVVAIVVTTLAVADRGTDPPPPSTTPTPGPTLAANQIPPVMGLDLEDALHLMSERRLNVELVNKDACVSDRVVAGSSPTVGARFRPQDTVKLTVLNPTEAFCVSREWSAWQLLRFALDVADPPPFAPTVTLYAGDAEPVELTAEEAVDPGHWTVCDGENCTSPLSALATAATSPSQTGVGPFLTTTEEEHSKPEACVPSAETHAGDASLRITIAEPMDYISLCATATLFYSADGLISAVAVPLAGPSDTIRRHV